MKNKLIIATSVCLMAFVSCKKTADIPTTETKAEAPVPDNYSSLDDFYKKNEVALKSFTINAAAGGSFVSAQGTTINIPANSFTPATAIITIEFKDIYVKSDFLLSGMPAVQGDGSPLVSGGQFYIKALNGNSPVSSTNTITVSQPFREFDKAMGAYIASKDSSRSNNVYTWSAAAAQIYSLTSTATSYISSMFITTYLNWYNTDHPFYAPTVTLTVVPNQSNENMKVYMIFHDENSSAMIFKDNLTSKFVCRFAPKDRECTVVAILVKEGKLFASFNPVTLNSSKSVNIELKETTTEKFKNDLKELN